MVNLRDNLCLAVDAIRAHKLRASLTILGLTMGVATLDHRHDARAGRQSFTSSRKSPTSGPTFSASPRPPSRWSISPSSSRRSRTRTSIHGRSRRRGRALPLLRISGRIGQRHALRAISRTSRWTTSTIYGYSPNMADIDTRTLDQGRYFTRQRRSPRGLRLHHRRVHRESVLSGSQSGGT